MAKIHKTLKLKYYIKSFLIKSLPTESVDKKKKKLISKLSIAEVEALKQRVDYYCKLERQQNVTFKNTVRDLKKPVTPKAYYFDTYEYARYFDENQKINYEFGDVTWIPKVPAIVKSRPISDDNQNAVLLNLDKARHFVFVENDKNFLEKKDLMIGRAAVYQEHRYKFYEQYFNHPLCDLGQVNKRQGNLAWLKPKIPIEKHLDYKFILSLQGNDVATNLKWIMSSNSIAVMPKPTLETWFMEGKLEGGKHYIEIKHDYSDLEEQLNFYIAHPEKCLEIIKNAHEHCAQFFNKNSEDLCSLLVLEKYFNLSK